MPSQIFGFENDGQLLIFPTAQSNQVSASDEAAEGSVATAGGGETGSNANPASKPAKPKKQGHGRNDMPEDLPRVPVIANPPEAAKLHCECCGSQRVAGRQILQNSRYEYIPASFHIEDLYSVVYECRKCKDAPQLVAKVAEPVKNGKAGAGLLAQVAVAKGTDHLPFQSAEPDLPP